jgi:hypothetical protein
MSEWVEGNYAAKTKAATVYEKEGKLLLAVAFDVGGTEMKSYFVLVQADGSLNTASIAKIREWSGWDGIDPYWFVEATPDGIECEVVVKNETGFKDPTKMYPKIAWVNKAGGSGTALPDPANRNMVIAKYGAKFRAVAGPQPIGTKPAVTPAVAPTVAPVATAPTSGPAPRPAKRPAPMPASENPVTLQECWEMMQKGFKGLNQDQMTEKWYGFVDATGMDQADMTPEGWQTVKSAIIADPDYLPF